jgi:hypothetical protein
MTGPVCRLGGLVDGGHAQQRRYGYSDALGAGSIGV